MKKTIFLAVFIILIASCNKIKTKLPSEPEVQQKEEIAPPAAKEEQGMEVPDVPLGFLVTYNGKYAAQEKLFEHKVLADRLQQLDRFNYEALLLNYNTETPVRIVDNIVHMSGCKQHDCPSNAYDFFIDLEQDNINVYHFRSNMLRIYQEKGWIDLPEEFASEMETKKLNAGIGDPESTESKYEL
jgi:biopolymer transport protein ExbD